MSKSPNDEMCRECKFWLPLQGTRDVNSQSGFSVGACRRFPPTGKACQYEGYPSRVSLVMLPESWCGEFKPVASARVGSRRLLDELEGGDVLGMAPNRVTRLADERVIPSVCLRDGTVGFLESELRAWAAEQQGKGDFR